MKLRINKEEMRCERCNKYGVYVGIIRDFHQAYCNDCEGWWIVAIHWEAGEEVI